MKLIILVVLSFFALSCNSKKEMLSTSVEKVIVSNCPEDGVCAFKILKNKTLTLKKDAIGASYPVINEGEKTLIKFEYSRNSIPNVQDANYTELVYIEIDTNKKELNIKDIDLKTVKATFARLCFCRGQTGYYPIESGNLNIKSVGKNQYKLDFEFKISEVPQVITKIKETFSL